MGPSSLGLGTKVMYGMRHGQMDILKVKLMVFVFFFFLMVFDMRCKRKKSRMIYRFGTLRTGKIKWPINDTGKTQVVQVLERSLRVQFGI